MSEDFISRPEHEEFVKRMDEANERQSKRISILEDTVRNFAQVQASMQKMETIMDSTLKEIEKQGKRLERLEAKDGEMWRKVVGYIITAIVGIMIGFVFKQLGM